MRILFVLHQFFPEFSGGTERVALNLARMAQHAGHHVRILACTVDAEKTGGIVTDTPVRGSVEAVYQGLAVTLIPKSMLPATSDISMDADDGVVDDLAGWIKSGRFDVAHVLHTMRMGSALLAIQQSDVPYVLSLTDFFLPCARINLITLRNQPCLGPDNGHRCAHDCPTAPWTDDAYLSRFVQAKSILKAAGARIAPSEYVAGRYRDIFPGVDIQVIPHGVDLLSLGVVDGKTTAPTALSDALRMVYVGSIIPQKGLDVLLQAMALIPDAPITLKVIGGFYGEPDYHKKIEALVRADRRVELTGSLDARQVFTALGEASLLCLPSVVPESFSLAFHESAAAGTPALVSDLGAPAQHIRAHNCGRVVAAGSPQAWASAIGDLVDAPDTLKFWKKNLFLPLRIEEEAFFFESVYQRLRCE